VGGYSVIMHCQLIDSLEEYCPPTISATLPILREIPRKMGFLSTVPNNARDLMKEAVAAARMLGNFPSMSSFSNPSPCYLNCFIAVLQVAPTKVPLPASTDPHGVPQVTSLKFTPVRTSDETRNRSSLLFIICLFALIMFGREIGE
jgi:hypothetical protein